PILLPSPIETAAHDTTTLPTPPLNQRPSLSLADIRGTRSAPTSNTYIQHRHAFAPPSPSSPDKPCRLPPRTRLLCCSQAVPPARLEYLHCRRFRNPTHPGHRSSRD